LKDHLQRNADKNTKLLKNSREKWIKNDEFLKNLAYTENSIHNI